MPTSSIALGVGVMTPQPNKVWGWKLVNNFFDKIRVVNERNNIFRQNIKGFVLLKKNSLIYINSFETLIVWGLNIFCILQGILRWFKVKNPPDCFVWQWKENILYVGLDQFGGHLGSSPQWQVCICILNNDLTSTVVINWYCYIFVIFP